MQMREIEKETQNITEENIMVVRQVFEAFNSGNTSKVNE
jgi:hypothetical protein